MARVAAIYPGTALDYLIGSYARSLERLSACIDILLEAGGATRYDAPGVLALLRGRLDRLAELIDADPHSCTGDFLNSIAADRRAPPPASRRNAFARGRGIRQPRSRRLLLDRGADVNARATVDEAGIGGQTAIFHAVTQFDDGGLPVTQLLVERGADLAVRVKLPGDYERPGEIVECTPLGYALLFPDDPHGDKRGTVTFLRERGAME